MIDGYFIHKMVQELNQELAKSRLEKIIQQDDKSFIFLFYRQGTRCMLFIDLSSELFRIHITEQTALNQVSSHYVMMLKKQLEGAILQEVKQYLTDRVILLEFLSHDLIDGPVRKTLVFEAMGKHSNLILVKDGVIIDTYKKMFFETGRQLLPQAKFEFFPAEKAEPFMIDYTQMHSPQDLVNTYMGLSLMLAKYLFERKMQWTELPFHPTRDITKNKFYVFDIFDEENVKKHYTTLSEMLDDDIKSDKPIYVSEKIFIEKQIKKLHGKMHQLELSLQDAIENQSQKELGDIIYSSGLNLSLKQSDIQYEDQTYMLDPTKTLNENAQEAYKAYQKAKRGIHHIQQQLEQTKQLIEHFESLSFFITVSSHDTIKDLDQELVSYGYKKAKVVHQPKKKDKPHLLTLKDGDIIYTIGRNNLQNEYITHTLAKKDDTWFHVKDAPGSHVTVNVSELNEPILRKACMLAAYFSSLRHSSSIPVDYTKIKYIKKIPGTPGYKVIYSKQQTMYIDIDEVKINSYLKNV